MWHRYLVVLLQNKNREICGDHRRDLDSTPDSFNALDTCMLFSRTSVYRQPSCRFSQLHHAFRFQCEILLEPLNLQDPSARFGWVFSHIQMEEPHQILGKDSKTLPAGSHRMIQSDRQFMGTQSPKNIWNRRITDALPGLQLRF